MIGVNAPVLNPSKDLHQTLKVVVVGVHGPATFDVRVRLRVAEIRHCLLFNLLDNEGVLATLILTVIKYPLFANPSVNWWRGFRRWSL